MQRFGMYRLMKPKRQTAVNDKNCNLRQEKIDFKRAAILDYIKKLR